MQCPASDPKRIARKPPTHLFSTAACSMALFVGVDCERELTREPEANFGLGVLLPRMYDHFLSLGSPSGPSIGHTHMPKFLRIGVHQSNVSGYTSKAWWVRRVGSTVFLKWGEYAGEPVSEAMLTSSPKKFLDTIDARKCGDDPSERPSITHTAQSPVSAPSVGPH